jgi:hypothetical protein
VYRLEAHLGFQFFTLCHLTHLLSLSGFIPSGGGFTLPLSEHGWLEISSSDDP